VSQEILSLSLRPNSLDELVGQKQLVASIRQQMAERPPRAFLFHGGTGSGKSSIARIFALSFQCTHQKVFGTPCTDCISRNTEFAIHNVNASEINGVEEIGRVAQFSRFKPQPPSIKRVIILDEAQRVSTPAQNLLLDYFENTPEYVVWIICTTEPSKLLQTLRRRCMSYQLKPLSIQGREFLLKKAAKTANIKRPIGELIEAAINGHVSSPALLLMSLEKYNAGHSAQDAVAGTDPSNTDTLRICKAVTSGNWNDLKKFLSDAQNEESRWIQSSVGGWLKGILMRETDLKRRQMVAKSLTELMGNAPYDNASLMLWLFGHLHTICERFKT